MFANCMAGGMNLGFPDVCKTPTPVGPVPLPYPNISTGATANPLTTALNVLIDFTPAMTEISQVPMSLGDTPGLLGGVVSNMVMFQTEYILGSFSVFVDCAPVTRMTSMTGQNGMAENAIGLTLAPGQVNVLVLG